MIKTTYVMKHDVREALDRAMVRTGLGRDELLVLAVEKTLQNHTEHEEEEGSIVYQERSPVGTKSRGHVKLGKMEYEFFQDMRKFFKKSISFIIAISIVRYLDVVVQNIINGKKCEKKDNYPEYKYTILKKCIETDVFWLIYWGLPPEVE